VADLEIRSIDPFDEPLLHEWWATSHAAHAHRPYDLGFSWEFRRTSLTRPNPEREVILLAAFDGPDGGRMVGAAELQFPLKDNTHLAYVAVDVPAESRRHGTGTRLLGEVEERVRVAERSHVLAEAFCPPGGTSAGREFGRAHGYAEAGLEQVKVIDLLECGPALDALEAEVLGGLFDYRIVTWGTETPEEYVESYCRLLSVFIGEMPMEDLALEDSEWTPERLRAHEARGRDLGRVGFVAAAVAPDGQLAGVHDLRPSIPDLAKAYVGITLVDRDHRGHSLGLAMKLATHRELRATYPQCRIVATGNAGVNEHMNAINERMGYRVVEDLISLQKAL
jgi:GNAT superfamily N-acetyltransferase